MDVFHADFCCCCCCFFLFVFSKCKPENICFEIKDPGKDKMKLKNLDQKCSGFIFISVVSDGPLFRDPLVQ